MNGGREERGERVNVKRENGDWRREGRVNKGRKGKGRMRGERAIKRKGEEGSEYMRGRRENRGEERKRK